MLEAAYAELNTSEQSFLAVSTLHSDYFRIIVDRQRHILQDEILRLDINSEAFKLNYAKIQWHLAMLIDLQALVEKSMQIYLQHQPHRS